MTGPRPEIGRRPSTPSVNTEGLEDTGAQILVIHGDGSPPAHKQRQDTVDWGEAEGLDAYEDGASEGGSRPMTASGTALYTDEALNDHPVLLQYLAESSLAEAAAGGGGQAVSKGRPRSFVQRLRVTAEVMEQTKSLDPSALADRADDARPGTGLRAGTPLAEMARPGTAAVLDDILGNRLGTGDQAPAGGSNTWADAEPRETIRQLLRVIGDLRAENRELKQGQQRKALPHWDGTGASQRIEQLESENKNMFHLMRENEELSEKVEALTAQLQQHRGGEPSSGGSNLTTPAGGTGGDCPDLGETVEADYQAEGDYYLGKIVFDHGDGTFDIMYEDGDQEQRVPLTRIRKVKDPESIRKVNQSKEDADEPASAEEPAPAEDA